MKNGDCTRKIGVFVKQGEEARQGQCLVGIERGSMWGLVNCFQVCSQVVGIIRGGGGIDGGKLDGGSFEHMTFRQHHLRFIQLWC